MRKVFLEELPRDKRGRISWKKSIGYKVKFIYDDIEDEIEIIDYYKNNYNKPYLTIKYIDKIKPIFIGHFKKCKLGNILGKHTKDFKIKIGETFKDDKRDIIIIDKEIREVKIKDKKYKKGYTIVKQKWYKYKCNKDFNEDWIEEHNLLSGVGCNVCSGDKVTEYNCMWNTDRELCIMLGVPEEIAKTITRGSNIPITFNCKCGNEVTISPNTIISNKSIGCKKCGDGKSYPEKFIYNALEQSKECFETEYSPKYLNGKRNDFYLPNLNIVIEADGRLGHEGGSVHNKSNKTLEECVEVDKWKEEQNLKHGIKTIRIDCFKSELEYIKNNILTSELAKYIDFSNIDWNKCEEFALKNIVKDVCDYWYEHREVNKEDITTADLTKIFSLSNVTIVNYLKKGTKFNWCNYTGNKKPILMYDKDMNFIGEYEGCRWLDKHSDELFGIYLDFRGISSVATGKRSSYKGFIFKYAKDVDK